MEIWKDIYFWQDEVEFDYRGLYQVSSYGRVKSLNYNHTGKEKILKPFDNGNGYEIVVLCKNKRKKIRVHRLVAHMFIEGYFDGADVDHIDTDRTNNHVSNLRWCTRKENCNNELSKKHCSEAMKGKNKGKNPYAGKTEEELAEIRRKRSKAHKGEKNGRATLVDRFDLKGNYIDTKYQFEYVRMGFGKDGISKCCKGKQKSTGGYVFKYHNK